MRTVHTTVQCSTPFGINERGTEHVEDPQALAAAVLNAFRHQRTRIVVRLPLGGHRQPRAQRLSASTNEELAIERQGVCPRWVLNAFRHQRTRNHASNNAAHAARQCSTPFGINERGTTYAGRVVAAMKKCSTPFGINERGTTFPPLTCHCFLRVLNAFRHQRTRNPPFPWPRGQSQRCAQRLSASTNEERSARWTGGGCGPRSAQRLSASTNEELSPPVGVCGDGQCSTPFGINERGTTSELYRAEAA